MLLKRLSMKAAVTVLLLIVAVTTFAQSVSSLTLSPSTVTAGCSSTGTVTLTSAPTANLAVSLSAGVSLVGVPASVTVAAGSTSATFELTTTSSGGSYASGVYASVNHSSAKAVLNVVQETISSLTLSPSTVTSGASSTGTVSLSSAPTSNFVVSLSSAINQVSFPSSVTIPAGATSATFTLTTANNGGNYSSGIYATCPHSSAKAVLTVVQATISSLTLSPSSVTGGCPSTGTVTLSAAPTGNVVINLSAALNLVGVPASVTVPAGSTTATFNLTTTNTGGNYSSGVYATCPHSSAKAVLSVVQDPVASLAFSPSTVTGGCTSTGTVTLNSAPTGNVTIALSSASSLIGIPASVVVLAGSTTATFTATATNSGGNYSTGIYATIPHSSAKAVLSVVQDAIASVGLSHTTVAAGYNVTGTVTLTAAPTGSFVVDLSSAIGLVELPASVTVPAGATTANFTATTTSGGSNYVTSIYATSPHSSAKAVLSVFCTPWPTYSANYQRTGRGLGSGAVGNLVWSRTPTTYGLDSPVIDANHNVILCDTSGNIYSISSGGSLNWSYSTGDFLYCDPAIDAHGNIIVTSQFGYIYSLGPNGNFNWSASTDSPLHSSPAIDPNGDIIVCSVNNDTDTGGVVYSFSSTGSLNWMVTSDGDSFGSASVDVHGNILVCGGNSGYVYSFNPGGNLNWKCATGGVLYGSPCVDSQGNIYVDSFEGGLFSISPSGTLNWSNSSFGDRFYGTPAIDPSGNIILCGENFSNVYSVSPSGSINWTCATDDHFITTAAIDAVGNIIVCGLQGGIYSISPGGVVNWKLATTEFFETSPAIDTTGSIVVSGTYSHVLNIH